jgi:serine/threonine protein kinase
VTSASAGRRAELEAVRAALDADYEIIEEIGRGGMAIVYRARERELDRDVAVKVLPPHLAFDDSFVERFQREGRIAAQLEHPHIVPIHRVGRSGDVVYLAMKLLRGESLAARLSGRGVLAAAEVRRILAETASALGYAARRGVVHRDIKPHNIVLDEDDRCVVTDFGIARSGSDSKLTATGMSVGTPRYMSPEQARAKPVDGRSDLYSLGIVGYECLVGATPFDGEDAFAILMEHIKAPVPRPVLRTDEEREVFAVIERLLAKDPDERFQSGEEVVAALSGRAGVIVASSAATTSTTPTSVVPPTRAVGGLSADSTAVEPSGPQPSPALDQALRIGLELIRRQLPKVGTGLRALTARAPTGVVGGGAQRAPRRPLAYAFGRGRAAVAVVGRGAAQARAYVTSRGRYFLSAVAAAAVLGVGSYYGVHFATKHRSRCPSADDAPGVTLQGDAGGPPRKRPFSLMLDPVETRRPGTNLDVYFDVCGLEKSTPYTAAITVTKTESGLRRLFGNSVGPVRVSYDEIARGPATRRHHTIEFSDMPPGSYWLEVVVTDAQGRRRAKGTGVRVLER